MSPVEQLDALYLRMLGIAFAGQSEPMHKLAEGSTVAEERHGSWCRSMERRVKALHEEYVAFLRVQVETAKKPKDVKK